MQLNLHANATTTPKTRVYIQKSTSPVARLATEPGVSETTVRRWKARSEVGDRSHVRHDPGQSTTVEEAAAIRVLRSDPQLSLDEVLEVMRRTIAQPLAQRAGALSRAPGSQCPAAAGRR